MTKNFKIGGKLYPVNFGQAALADVHESIGLNYTASGFAQTITFNLKSMQKIVYWGLFHGARVSGERWDLDLYGTIDLLETDKNEVDQKIIEYYGECQTDYFSKSKKDKAGAKS